MSCIFNLLNQNNLVLVASCPQVPGCAGGLLAFDGLDVECIDTLSSTGLCLAENQLFRLLWADNDVDAGTELLAYDARGVQRYFRLDELAEPHDIVWDGREFIIVCTGANRVLRVSRAGNVTARWQAPGAGDAWHLNSLVLHDNQVLVTAFGRFRQHREWNQVQAAGKGIVFNLATGHDVLAGLTCPHSPRFFDAAWTVCNSKSGELLQIDARTQGVRRSLQLHGWTRGIAVSDDYLFVGVSAPRHCTGPSEGGRIAVVCRHTWTVLEQITVPCWEVYDVVLAPAALLAGLRRGFIRHHAAAESTSGYQFLSRAGGVEARPNLEARGPLEVLACRVQVRARPPAVLTTNMEAEVTCEVQNLGNDLLVSAQPYPVHLSYRWIDPHSGQWKQEWNSVRTPLPRGLGPQQKASCTMRIAAPPQAGRYLLRITAVQEGVAWFDDLNRANCSLDEVCVVAPGEPG
jgi:hypothetical protein